jgi:hypothetical protein
VATERMTRKQRHWLVGLAAVALSGALVVGLVVLRDDGRPVSVETAPTTGSTTTTESTTTSETTRTTRPSGMEPATTPTSDNTAAVGGGEDQTRAGSTQACRADPGCPSSEHRTSDPCGAAIIVDTGGYLEGRQDAEQGLAYQIDGAPAPEPADNDDDDGTVGPETRYRAGYAQGWCDGGGTTAGAG